MTLRPLWASRCPTTLVNIRATQTGNVVRAYIFSSSGQRIALQSGVNFYWVHGDHLGSSHKLTDTSGNVAYTAEYDPHGNLRFENGTTTLTTQKFTGYERKAKEVATPTAVAFHTHWLRARGERPMTPSHKFV